LYMIGALFRHAPKMMSIPTHLSAIVIRQGRVDASSNDVVAVPSSWERTADGEDRALVQSTGETRLGLGLLDHAHCAKPS